MWLVHLLGCNDLLVFFGDGGSMISISVHKPRSVFTDFTMVLIYFLADCTDFAIGCLAECNWIHLLGCNELLWFVDGGLQWFVNLFTRISHVFVAFSIRGGGCNDLLAFFNKGIASICLVFWRMLMFTGQHLVNICLSNYKNWAGSTSEHVLRGVGGQPVQPFVGCPRMDVVGGIRYVGEKPTRHDCIFTMCAFGCYA